MPDNRRVLLKGEEAIVLAAAIAGADLYGYPITPVTGVVEMATHWRAGSCPNRRMVEGSAQTCLLSPVSGDK